MLGRRRQSRKVGGFVAAALVVPRLLSISCGIPERTRQGSARSIHIAFTNAPLPYLPVVLADALGYYRREGLSVNIDGFSAASKVMQSLLGGSADIGAGGYEQMIQMAAEGRHIKSFVLLLRQPTRTLVIAPKARGRIQRVEDLRGASIGVAGLGSINHLFLNYLLLKHGIAPSEIKPVAIGTAQAAIAAVQHDMVDGAILSGNETTIVTMHVPGIRVLVDARGPAGCRSLYGVDVYPTTVLYATGEWLRKYSDEARRVARAVQQTLTWMSLHSAREIAEATPKRYRPEDQRAELEALQITLPGFSRDGVMPVEGAKTVREALSFTLPNVRNASFNLSDTYTNEYVSNENR